MRIALEATAACRPVKTGVARYAIELMRALAAAPQGIGGEEPCEYTAYYRLSRLPKRGHARPRIEGLRSRWYQEPFPPLGRRPDLVHGLEVRVPSWRGVRRVATLHDVFGLVSPELIPERSRRRSRASYAAMARRAERIIADSECTRRDFLRCFDYPPEHVHVVHLGVDARFHPRPESESLPRARTLGIEPPYLLYVGDLGARKNLVRLLRAYRRSAAARECELVVVGAREHGAAEIEAELAAGAAAGVRPVRLLGRVDDGELPHLYAGAAAFLFPTLYEGFGLPVLEAQASGVPVLGASVGSVPEIAGPGSVLVDPTDEDALAEGIDRALAQDGEARARGREHAASFTWARCAAGTRAVYRSL